MARRRKRRSPVRKRRRTYRRNQPILMNPRRRRRARRYAGVSARRSRRRYGRNPPQAQVLGNQLGWATLGFMSTKFTGNLVTPMLGQMGGGAGQPIVRMGIKLAIAYGTAWLLENFMGRRVFVPTFIGGSIEVIQDFTRTFISPMIPALAQAEYPLEVYYEPPAITEKENETTLGDYYQGGDYQQM